MKIRIAGNTEGSCYFVIKSKGFNLEVVYCEEDEYSEFIVRKVD